MTERRDYLPVCNDHGVPLPDFQATFCIRCVQPECSRSQQGGLFETRVATWEERLFKSPPRMPREDPLYTTIAAKRFVEIDPGRIPEISGGKSEWMDPLAVTDAEPAARKPRPAPARRGADVEATVSEAEPQAEPSRLEPLPMRPLLNTPFAQGAMIGGAPAPAPSTAKPVDPWASVMPPASGPVLEAVPVVKTGARIKIGG